MLIVSDGAQRVAVLDNTNDVVGIVTPCGILRALHTRVTDLGSVLNLPIGSLFDMTSTRMITVNKNASIKKGFRALIKHGVSAAPIVDDSGSMVNILAFHQLRNIAALSPEAAETCFEEESVSQLAASRSATAPSGHSLTVCPQDSLATVIALLVSTRAHRVFVCDDDNVPIDVITIKRL